LLLLAGLVGVAQIQSAEGSLGSGREHRRLTLVAIVEASEELVLLPLELPHQLIKNGEPRRFMLF